MERDKTSLIGEKFNRWVVIDFGGIGKDNSSLWLCRCDCGNLGRVTKSNLLKGVSKSCGCWNKEVRHSHTIYNCKNNRLYSIHKCMKNRCYRGNRQEYRFYGARGITICDEWRYSFLNFSNWAMANGYDDSLSIDRIDSNGNYEPSNCRWSTPTVQSNNQRSNRIVIYHNVKYTMAELARELDVSYSSLRYHLDLGHNLDLVSITKHE